MSDERTQEIASLYVLGALPPDEALAFETRIRSEPELARLVAGLEHAAAALAAEAPPVAPPPQLRARLIEAVGHEARVVPFIQRFAWFGWAAAAVLAIVAGVLVRERRGLQEEIATLENRDIVSRIRIATLTSQLQAAPNGVASVAWDASRQEGVLDVRNLPPPEADKDYQLWVIDPSYETPVNAGVFQVRDGGGRVPFRPALLVRSADKFAVSIERKGGAPRHSGPIVLLGQ